MKQNKKQNKQPKQRVHFLALQFANFAVKTPWHQQKKNPSCGFGENICKEQCLGHGSEYIDVISPRIPVCGVQRWPDHYWAYGILAPSMWNWSLETLVSVHGSLELTWYIDGGWGYHQGSHVRLWTGRRKQGLVRKGGEQRQTQRELEHQALEKPRNFSALSLLSWESLFVPRNLLV